MDFELFNCFYVFFEININSKGIKKNKVDKFWYVPRFINQF